MAEPGAPISNLACSLAQLAALIEVLPTGIACHGGEKMILANQAMCEITGYSREQLLAMNFWELAHPRFQSLLRERGESRVRGTAAPARYEVVLVTARGEERWLDLLATAVKVDGRTIAIASYLDNTERKRAETRHMHARQELAQIIDSNPMPTFVIDHEHLITHWNKACEHMIGIKAADMVGTRNHQKVFYGKERLTMADLIVDGSMEARIRQMYRDKRLTRSQLIDGAYEAEDFFPHFGESGQWLYFAAAPLTDADGHLIGAVETLQDFTEQRFAESEMIKSKRELEALVTARGEQLREATRELEQDIARRETAEAELLQRFNELSALNAELKQAQQQLVQSEKLASIGQLAAGVAHEINNPIGFVQSNLGSLERYFEQIMALLDGYQEGEALLGGLVKDQEGGRVLMDKMQQLKKDTEL
ncbi:MAG: PAS domain S-box protein, partial [Polynucleobacter sp.]|nr:PAS domain S-box protein [Polynucleobacter sp.]